MMKPVDIRIILHSCEADHPHAVWVPPTKVTLTDKNGKKKKFNHAGCWRRWQSTLETTEIDPKLCKGLTGFVTHVTPELVEDVNTFHGGVIPNISLPDDKQTYQGKLVVKSKREEDNSIICEIVLCKKELC